MSTKRLGDSRSHFVELINASFHIVQCSLEEMRALVSVEDMHEYKEFGMKETLKNWIN